MICLNCMSRTIRRAAVVLATTCLAHVAAAGVGQFVNWESPHIHPMDLTPDGSRLLAVNTADNRLEIFDVDGDDLVRVGSIPVGLDPVSVRARTNDEAWVVNHVSDSISIVDLSNMTVRATITTGGDPNGLGDEPTDLVFAGAPQRAFVAISQENRVKVYDPDDVSAPPDIIPIAGEDPRALATDGAHVFAAIFESGNGSTVLGEQTVTEPVNPYPGDENPPPNDGLGFDPPMAAGLPDGPPVSHIVRKDGSSWVDGNGFDWSAAVTWDLHDHDVAIIDAGDLSVSYVSGLMNLNMHIAVRPGGDVTVIGTEAINEVRFEPNLNGRFIRVQAASFAAPGGAATITDLNAHLVPYNVPTVPQGMRDMTIADPRGIDWNTAGTRGFIAGMGTNNLAAIDASMSRLGLVEVGEGPTGVVVNDAEDVVYVMNKFEGSISVVSTTGLAELGRIGFFDPTPAAIRAGRPHLYDAHATSGLGLTSCGACHIDGRMDQIAWDLGDPTGSVQEFDQICNFDAPILNQQCEDWHPMKGPMTTQTLIGIIGTEPLHWRADRGGLADFNGAFESLLGDDQQLTTQEMNEFEAFVATLTTPPNPFRNIDHSLKTSLTIDGNPPRVGNPSVGQSLYNTAGLDGVECVTCHALPSGTNGQLTSGNLLQESQSMKIPQLRNMYEKTGFESMSLSSNRGFGFIHDGSVDTLLQFLQFSGFQFDNDQQRIDVEAFMFSFGTDTHAGVGVQATVTGEAGDHATLRDQMIGIDNGSSAVGLVAKGVVDGEQRGYFHAGGGAFRSDRVAESVTLTDLDDASSPATPITYTLVPGGSEVRIGVDRDSDGVYDRDELDVCAHPGDPSISTSQADADCCAAVCAVDPACCSNGWDAQCTSLAATACNPCPGDTNGDLVINVDDLVNVILDWGTDGSANGGDVDGSGSVDVDDLVFVIVQFGTGC